MAGPRADDRPTLDRGDIERWSTTVLVDTENVFYWSGGRRGNRRGQALDRMSRTVLDGGAGTMRLWDSDPARTAAVFSRMADWLTQRLEAPPDESGTDGPSASAGYDLRSYGKTEDPAVRAVRGCATEHHWVHVGVSDARNAADVALAADLRDRSRRTELQRFVVASSDGAVLEWAAEAASDLGSHEYLVLLGPDLPHPREFAPGGRFAPLTWLSTVAELFADVVRAEKGLPLPARRATPEQLHYRAGQPHLRLGAAALLSELAPVQKPSEFLWEVRQRMLLLPRVKSRQVRDEVTSGLPSAVYDAWRAGHPDEAAGSPAYASRQHVSTRLGSAGDLSQLVLWEEIFRHAVRQQTDPDRDLEHLRRCGDAARADLGPRGAGDTI